MLVPKLVTTLRGYGRDQLASDASAGFLVGIVALPLSVAFAAASGVSPERGIVKAIVAGFLVSLLGGSRVQIAGPTGALVVVVYTVVHRFGLAGLTLAALMAGAMLVLLGLSRLGSAVKFIPRPVTTGFTSGIAVLIFSSQVRDLLGLPLRDLPPGFLAQWAAYADSARVDWPVLALGAASIALILGLARVSRRLPGFAVVLVLGTLASRLFHLPVPTLGSRFGVIQPAFAVPALPPISLALLAALLPSALGIALLCAVSSLLSAVVTDGMTGGRHRSNMELVAQGVANIVAPLVGGMPASGAIARTATNVKSGGRTPVSGMVHAATLLVIMLLFGRWLGDVPLACLAAILTVVAYNMGEWRAFRSELTAPRSDVAVLLITFFLTVVVDLTVAIEVGMVLASFLFMRRMAEVTNVSVVARELHDPPRHGRADGAGVRGYAIPRGVEVYEINGPFFFGAAEAFKDTLACVAERPAVLIIRMRAVPAIDATGLHALRDVVHRSRVDGTLVLLSEVHMQPLVALGRSDLLEDIGEENLFDSLDGALGRAREWLEVPALR